MSDSDHTRVDERPVGAAPTAELSVRTDPDHDRFDLWLGGELVGILGYRDEAAMPGAVAAPGTVLALMHTVVKEEFGGRGFAAVLVAQALDDIRGRGLLIRPVCTYVQRFLSLRPEYGDLVDE